MVLCFLQKMFNFVSATFILTSCFSFQHQVTYRPVCLSHRNQQVLVYTICMRPSCTSLSLNGALFPMCSDDSISDPHAKHKDASLKTESNYVLLRLCSCMEHHMNLKINYLRLLKWGTQLVKRF